MNCGHAVDSEKQLGSCKDVVLLKNAENSADKKKRAVMFGMKPAHVENWLCVRSRLDIRRGT